MEKKRRKEVTIGDVARRAGVSISTVSYVMNGQRRISEETHNKVIEIAKALGYIPKNRKRAQELGLLSDTPRKVSRVLALSSPIHRYTDLTNYAIFFFALAQRARQYGYDILLLMHESGDEELKRVTRNGMVDGILLLDLLLSDSRVETAKQLSVPVVGVGYPINTANIWSVDLDFERMGREAVDRAYSLGHREIAILGGISFAYQDGSNYLVRFRDAAMKHADDLGVKVFDQELTGYSKAEINLALDQMLTAEPTVSAIIWQGSTSGAGMLMEILNERGLKVPQNISVLAACTYGASRLPRPIDELPMDPNTTCNRAVDIMMEILDGKRNDVGNVELLKGNWQIAGTMAQAPGVRLGKK